MTEVLSRVREVRIFAFCSAKQCNSPDVFPKDSMLFPDQPRHILCIHLCLLHVRNEDVVTDLHLPCSISIFPGCPEGGNKKSRMDLDLCKWGIFSVFFYLLLPFRPSALCAQVLPMRV